MIRLSKVMSKLAGTLLFAVASLSPAWATPVVYGFDTFDDSTPITTQYAGLTFSQTTALKAGFSLNDFAFPPRSLDTVVVDDGGPINITFQSPVFSVGGYFTYASGLTVVAYDSNDNLIDTSFAAFLVNSADGSGDAGSAPNEFLQVTSAGGLISRVTFTSALAGSSFVLDDLTVDAGVNASVPEPSSLALIAGLLGAGLLRRGWLRRS